MKNYYSILQIAKKASEIEIKIAYRTLSKKYHPDINKAPNASLLFIEIKEAYEILKDDARRKQYDHLLDFAEQAKSNTINVIPTIFTFYCDTPHFSVGDIVTFTWKVLDADNVELRPFGKVSSSGTKKIKITEVQKNLLVELFCTNSVSRNSVFSQIILIKKDTNVSIDNKHHSPFVASEKSVNASKKESLIDIKSKEIKIWNFRFNKPSKLAMLICFISIINLVYYISFPFIYIQESELIADRVYSKNIYNEVKFFIEFENFTVETNSKMAEEIQKLKTKKVYIGVNSKTNEVAYFRIKNSNINIKQNISGINTNESLLIFYFIILVTQFYFIFIENKVYLTESFSIFLGFLFVFNLVMSFVIFQ